MGDWENLLDSIDEWRAAYDREQARNHEQTASNAASVRAGSGPGQTMAKSLPAEDVDAVALHHRIIEGGRSFDRHIKKMSGTMDEMAKSLVAKPGPGGGKREGDDRRAKASWLLGKLSELDRCIAAGSVSAEQAAIVENRIHHAARRMGLT